MPYKDKEKHRENSRDRWKKASPETKLEILEKSKLNKRKPANKRNALIYQRERCRRHKDMAVELLGGKCSICGLVDLHCVYDFHHIDPSTKEIAVSYLFGRSWDKVLLEVSKCILLCSNCHRKLHYKQEIKESDGKEEGRGSSTTDVSVGVPECTDDNSC